MVAFLDAILRITLLFLVVEPNLISDLVSLTKLPIIFAFIWSARFLYNSSLSPKYNIEHMARLFPNNGVDVGSSPLQVNLSRKIGFLSYLTNQLSLNFEEIKTSPEAILPKTI